MFSFGKDKSLPPEGVQIGSRFWETRHISPGPKLAAHLIPEIKEELMVDVAVTTYRGAGGRWWLEFDVRCPELLVTSGYDGAEVDLQLDVEDFVNSFNWMVDDSGGYFYTHITTRQPWESERWNFKWGTVEDRSKLSWRIPNRVARLRNMVLRSRPAKWFVML